MGILERALLGAMLYITNRPREASDGWCPRIKNEANLAGLCSKFWVFELDWRAKLRNFSGNCKIMIARVIRADQVVHGWTFS
jgi:hypothetical protein